MNKTKITSGLICELTIHLSPSTENRPFMLSGAIACRIQLCLTDAMSLPWIHVENRGAHNLWNADKFEPVMTQNNWEMK